MYFTKKNLDSNLFIFIFNPKKLIGDSHIHVHIVPFGNFHSIGGAPPETFPNVKYDAPEEMGGNKLFFDSPVRN